MLFIFGFLLAAHLIVFGETLMILFVGSELFTVELDMYSKVLTMTKHLPIALQKLSKVLGKKLL